MIGSPILSVDSVSKKYATYESLFSGSGTEFFAVDNVSLSVKQGVNLGIVGQSGSGKTTLAGLMAGIHRPDSGYVCYNGESINGPIFKKQYDKYRRSVQMIFQNPDQSLNPRLKVRSMLSDLLCPMFHSKKTILAESERLMAITGLEAAHLERYPAELSGGQKQRVSIARALAVQPKIIIADEPVSSLDVSVQAQILNLMSTLNKELGVTFVLISHDLSVVSWLCDETAVMNAGKVVELGKTEQLLSSPQHSYTKELILSAYH